MTNPGRALRARGLSFKIVPMEILAKLFDSSHRPKLLRLFLFSSEQAFTKKDVAKKSKVPMSVVGRELNMFDKIKFIKTGTETIEGKKQKVWKLNPKFPLIKQLRYLLDIDFEEHRSAMLSRFKNCGNIKLFIIAGALIGDTSGEVDLVIVGDNLKKIPIEQAIKNMEAEAGREFTYALLETREFTYRFDASDKFIRDLLDFPHEKLIQKITL